jgi:hypothetical protein
MFPLTTKLAGVKFDACQDNIKKYAGSGVGDFELVREPDNPLIKTPLKSPCLDIFNASAENPAFNVWSFSGIHNYIYGLMDEEVIFCEINVAKIKDKLEKLESEQHLALMMNEQVEEPA